MDQQLLTAAEVARLLRVDPATVTRIERDPESGFPRAFVPGKRKRFYPAAAVREWIAARSRGGQHQVTGDER